MGKNKKSCYNATFYIIILVIFFSAFTNQSFSQRGRVSNSDTTLVNAPDDTTKTQVDIPVPPKDTVKSDSTDFSEPIKRHGSVSMLSFTPYREISKHDLLNEYYLNLSNTLNNNLFAYNLNTGQFCQFNHVYAYGLLPGSIGFSFNNRNMNDIQFGTYDPGHFPTEFIERIEVLSGSDAVILGDNNYGLSVNFQEIINNSSKPYTRLWIAQSAGDFTGVDAIYSQNFIKNWNVAVGFRRNAADGRYDNTKSDNWTLREKIRWNPSNLASVSFSYIYTNNFSEYNGGIDPVNSINNNGSANIYDDIYAVSNYKNTNEKYFKHDINVTYSQYLDNDTSAATTMTAYMTSSGYRSNYDSSIAIAQGGPTDGYYDTDLFGVTVKWEQELFKTIQYRAGGDLYHKNIPGTALFESKSGFGLTGFFHTVIKISEEMGISGGGRIKQEDEKLFISLGGKVYYNLPDFKITADLSRTEKPHNPTEGYGLPKESHIFGLFEVSPIFKDFELIINAWFRLMNNPVVFEPVYNDSMKLVNVRPSYLEKENLIGGGVYALKTFILNDNIPSFGLSIVNIKVSGKLNGFSQFESSDLTNSSNPVINGTIDFSLGFKAGISTVDLGMEYQFITRSIGYQLYQPNRTYTTFSDDYSTSYMNLGLFLYAMLGNASVRLRFDNIISDEFYYIPYYPSRGGHFTFSVSWPFTN